eukprot:g1785.t1
MRSLPLLLLAATALTPSATTSSTTTTPGCAEPRGDDVSWRQKIRDHGFTLAHFNVEWLFDEPLSADMKPWLGTKADTNLETRLGAVADILGRIDPDIVHFAEVNGCSVLGALASARPPAVFGGGFHPYLIPGTDTHLGQQVGLLSRLRPRLPLSRSELRGRYPQAGSGCGGGQGQGEKTTSLSKHLVALFDLPAAAAPAAAPAAPAGTTTATTTQDAGDRQEQRTTLAIIGLHLKARPTDARSCNKREGQAAVVRHLVGHHLARRHHVVVLGDLNDFDADVPDRGGRPPTSAVLRMIRDVDGDGTMELWNAMEAVPAADRYTNWWDKNGDGIEDPAGSEWSVLDHVLVSESLRPCIAQVGIDHGHDPTRVSDHWPMFVRFANLTRCTTSTSTSNNNDNDNDDKRSPAPEADRPSEPQHYLTPSERAADAAAKAAARYHSQAPPVDLTRYIL